MKQRKILTCLILVAFTLFMACEEKETFVPVKIFTIEPLEALIGDTLVITGEGFSPGAIYNDILFTGLKDKVDPMSLENIVNNPLGLSNTTERLYVIVPEGAQPGPVSVSIFDDENSGGPVVNILSPVIESIAPQDGVVNDTVTIRGRNFQPVPKNNVVRFYVGNNFYSPVAATIAGGAPGELKVLVPANAVSGPVKVGGIGSPVFTVRVPAITDISPTEGLVGDTVTISGVGFLSDNSTRVFFGGNTEGASGNVLTGSTARQLKVIIPATAVDGALIVRFGQPGSSIQLAGEKTFKVFPSITSITPASGVAGTKVTINGFKFASSVSGNEIRLNGVKVPVAKASVQQLEFTVPRGSVSGPLTVSVDDRVAKGPVFTISSDGPPIIIDLSPASGPVGSLIVINGDYFSPVPANNVVRFGGNVQGEVTAASTTQLTVKVPLGTTTGSVTVTRGGKTGDGTTFTLTDRATPVIASISPTIAPHESNITITGANFGEFQKDIKLVYEGCDISLDLPVVSFSPTEIITRLPPRNSGALNIPTCQGTLAVVLYENKSNKVPVSISGTPSVTSLSAASGFVGSELTIIGVDLHNIDSLNSVTFRNVNNSSLVAVVEGTSPGDLNLSTVKVIVPELPAGNYMVFVSAFGQTSNAYSTPYTVMEKPAIEDLSPTHGPVGTLVTIKVNGNYFSSTASSNTVRFGGDVRGEVTAAAPTQLTVRVPKGAITGAVIVQVTGYGIVTGSVFDVAPAGTPLILGISPSSGPVGSLIIIDGDFFSPVVAENTVLFGGNKAGEVTVASPTRLTVKVPVDAVTGAISVTRDSKTSIGPLFTLTDRATPVISSINPVMAPHESNIIITGANFGEFKQDIRVTYQGCGASLDLSIVSLTATEIIATLPPRTQNIGGSGIITIRPCQGSLRITLYGKESDLETVTISSTPSITSLSTTSGFSGSQLTLTGVDLHNIDSLNTVTFSNGGVVTEAEIANLNDGFLDKVTVFVPNLTPGNYTVGLTAFDNTSNTLNYQVKEKPAAVKNVYYAINNVNVPDPNNPSSTTSGLRVEKQTFDPSSINTVYERTPISSLRSMVMDLTNNKVYYATTTRVLGRNNLDNSGNETLYNQATPTTTINDITLDVTGGKVYWTTGNTVMRVAAAGGTPDPVVYTAASGVVITAILYEATNNKLYVYEKTTSSSLTGSIVSLNTDGSGRTVIFSSVPNLFDLKIDVANGKLFFSSATSSSLAGPALNIFQGNLDGSGSTSLYLPFGGTTTIATGSNVKVAGISLDITDKYLYFLANPAGTSLGTGVYRMRYDGAVIPGTNPAATVERVYQATGGTGPLGTALSFAAGLVVENSGGASQRMSMSLTMEYMNMNPDDEN